MNEALGKMCGKAALFVKRNSPTILSYIAAGGVVATGITSATATIKAVDICQRQREGETTPTKQECAKAAWKCYILPLTIAASTVICIFSANVLSKKKQEAITSAYMLLENTFKEYKAKVTELYGNDADISVYKSIAEDKLRANPISPSEGKHLFYDTYSGDYFESTLEDVICGEYHFNRNFVLRGYGEYNELLDFWGRPAVEYGNEVGWNIDAGLDFYGYQWVDFTHELSISDDGLECYIIRYPFEPHLEYEPYPVN